MTKNSIMYSLVYNSDIRAHLLNSEIRQVVHHNLKHNTANAIFYVYRYLNMKRSQVNDVCCKQKVQKHVLNTLKWLKSLIYTWVLTKNTQGTTVINIVCNTPVWVQNVNNSWQKINSLKLFQSLQQIRIESTWFNERHWSAKPLAQQCMWLYFLCVD